MKKISFVCNTNKKDLKYIHTLVEKINSLDLCGCTKEILIYSKEDLGIHDTINYTFDQEPYNPKYGLHHNEGSVYGYNYLVDKSTGDVVVISTDDNYFTTDFSKPLGLLEQSSFGFASLGMYAESLEDIFPGIDFGPMFGGGKFGKFYFGNHPIFKREFLKITGGTIWNPNFKHHYVDNWLGFWLKANGYIFPKDHHVSYPDHEHSNHSYNSHDKYVMLNLVLKYINSTKYNINY